MKTLARLMEIEVNEQQSYLAALRAAFGENILQHENGLSTHCQREWEYRRHTFNAQLQLSSQNKIQPPDRLLISATQRCTFACSHCWVFSSPTANCSLSMEDLSAIHEHTTSNNPPRWTISGGEFFMLPYYAEALAKFSIDCVFSNGFWGMPEERCEHYVKKIAAALAANPFIKEHTPTFILSYDSFHQDASNSAQLAESVAVIIATLYELCPNAAIRISHAQQNEDDQSYLEIIRRMKERGFRISSAERLEKNANIANILYEYQKEGNKIKELWVDTYPISRVCRAVMLAPSEPLTLNTHNVLQSSPKARYEYAVGPDGGVGAYQILYAPPVPYWVGDLVQEPWQVIAERAAIDPIAVSLNRAGTTGIVQFMKEYHPNLLQLIEESLPMTQPFLYHVLLDPARRMHLNAYLLLELIEEGTLCCTNTETLEKVRNLVYAKSKEERWQWIEHIYGKQFKG